MLECCAGSPPTSVATFSPDCSASSPTSSSSQSSAMASFLTSMEQRQNSFILHNPPLAALHNMTENKVPPHSATAAAVAASFYKQSGGVQPASVSHSINEILSRPPQLGGQLPRITASMYLNNHAAAAAAAAARLTKPISDIPGRPPVYWPAPSPWQQREQSSQPGYVTATGCTGSPGAGGQSLSSIDNKKKHTRPTFSGHQIFALEKTFEQTKYLAGPERARLAYALGMTESQVKVWFQNRRTKWRKRHAAEMATAKKKQEERATADDSDEDEDDDDQQHHLQLPPQTSSVGHFDFLASDNNNLKQAASDLAVSLDASLYPTMH